MSWDEIFKIIGAGIFSVASAGVMVVALASWLGKVWAERILRNETHSLQLKMAETQNALDTSLAITSRELDLLKESHAKIHSDKIVIYRKIIDLVATLLANLDAFHSGRLPKADAERHYDLFNEQRIQVYGYLAMFAPQAVMDAQDNLIDYLLRVAQGQQPYVWKEVRERALAFINEVRRDVGIDKTNIRYNGKL